jgi:type IV secretory pathway VirB2 component (pilin)
MLALVNDFLLANVSDDIVKTVQAYVGPILLLIIGIVALTFLFKREMMQFVIFIVIAILVSIFFYAPGVIKSIAQSFTGETGIDAGGDWGTP